MNLLASGLQLESGVMLNRQVMNPIKPVEVIDKVPPPWPIERVAEELAKRGVQVQIGKELKGGAVSLVHEARLGEEPVIVKYTFTTADPNPTVTTLLAESHYLDTKILQYLASHQIRTPSVIHSFDDLPVTVMEDMRNSGFELFETRLLEKNLDTRWAAGIGKSIAKTTLAMSKHPEIKTVESPFEVWYEYGMELRNAYPYSGKFEEVETRFTENNIQMIATDMHPKNLFVNELGEAAWIDFGRTVWGDRDFSLPNFFGDCIVYALAGHVETTRMSTFIEEVTANYRNYLDISDESICKYMLTEAMQRWNGRWIQGVETTDQKLNILSFCMKAIDDEVTSLDELLVRLSKV